MFSESANVRFLGNGDGILLSVAFKGTAGVVRQISQDFCRETLVEVPVK